MAHHKREPRVTNRKKSRRTNTEYNEIEENVHSNTFNDFKIYQEFELNQTHKSFIKEALDNNTNICIIDGPAGSGKTYLSILAALNLLHRKEIEEIVYIRSIVESASRRMGSLPGEADEKFLPWMYPLFDKLQELLISTDAKRMIEDGIVRGMPVNFARGATFRNSCVIVDEAQNLTREEIITVLTRIGENTKYFIIGDTRQTDIGNNSGFKLIYNLFDDNRSKEMGIHTHKFTTMDVVRSEILKYIVNRLEEL